MTLLWPNWNISRLLVVWTWHLRWEVKCYLLIQSHNLLVTQYSLILFLFWRFNKTKVKLSLWCECLIMIRVIDIYLSRRSGTMVDSGSDTWLSVRYSEIFDLSLTCGHFTWHIVSAPHHQPTSQSYKYSSTVVTTYLKLTAAQKPTFFLQFYALRRGRWRSVANEIKFQTFVLSWLLFIIILTQERVGWSCQILWCSY